MMIRSCILLLLLSVSVPQVRAQSASPSDDAVAVAQAAIRALGGADALDAIHVLDLDIRGHEFILDAFERADGPKPVEYDDIRYVVDFENQQAYLRKAVYIASEPPGRVGAFTASDSVASVTLTMPDGTERAFPARQLDLLDAQEFLALHPLRLFRTALAAENLQLHPDTDRDGVHARHLSFSWRGFDVHVFIDAATGLPYDTEVRGARPYDFSWAMWGDLTVRTIWYTWVRHESGAQIPYQWDIHRNGMPYMSRMIAGIEVNPEVEPGRFAISDAVRSAWAQREASPPAALTVRTQPAEGVSMVVTDFFPSVVVEQEDGLVLLEAPLSPASTRHLLRRLAERWPDTPVKAAVVAASALTQYGGVGALAAAGIPVYIAAHSEPVMDALVQAETGQSAWQVTVVSGRTIIGDGPNRLELMPSEGANTRGGMLVFMPETGLLYAGSALLPPGLSTIGDHNAWEIRNVAARAGWNVRNVYSMFRPVSGWD